MKSWVSQNNKVPIKEILSEPYSTVWRQPITFKLLRADWPPPRNRGSGTRRLAPNFLASSELLHCEFKFLLGVSEFSWADYNFKFFNMAYKMAISV